MLRVIRQLFAVAVLPFSVTVLVPVWLARRYGIVLAVGASPISWLAQVAGLSLFVVGPLLFVASLRRFDRDGNGTLAPWDPPRRLVVRGPYAYVRNPMISGVLLVASGEAMLQSRPHLEWALLFS